MRWHGGRALGVPCGTPSLTLRRQDGDALGSGPSASGSSVEAHPALKWRAPATGTPTESYSSPTIGQAQLGDFKAQPSKLQRTSPKPNQAFAGKCWEMQIREVKRIPDSAYPPSVKRDN